MSSTSWQVANNIKGEDNILPPQKKCTILGTVFQWERENSFRNLPLLVAPPTPPLQLALNILSATSASSHSKAPLNEVFQ